MALTLKRTLFYVCLPLVVRDVYPPYTLSGPTNKKKKLFYVCLALAVLLVTPPPFLQFDTLGRGQKKPREAD